MDREELMALIAQTGRQFFGTASRISDDRILLSLADAILTSLDESGFQYVKWLTTEELEASTVPAGYQIWTSSIYCDRSRDRPMIVGKDRHMIVASPYRKDEK